VTTAREYITAQQNAGRVGWSHSSTHRCTARHSTQHTAHITLHTSHSTHHSIQQHSTASPQLTTTRRGGEQRLVWSVYLSKSPVQCVGSCRICRCTIGAAQHLHQAPFGQAIDNAVSPGAGGSPRVAARSWELSLWPHRWAQAGPHGVSVGACCSKTCIRGTM
jgi:hypothetical protein